MIGHSTNPVLVIPTILGYINWADIGAAPVLPNGSTVQLWAQNTQGITRLHFQDTTAGDDIVVNRDLLFIARNVTGVTMTDGQVVYISGATGSIPQVSLAQSVAGKLPAVGIVMGTIANNGYGYVHMFGIHSQTNTNAFNVGDVLYVSASTPGALQNTAPIAPFQIVGIVLVKGVGNGSIFLRPNAPTIAHTVLDADEHSDTVSHVPVKGDLIVSNNTPKWDAIGVGSDGQVLTADSTQTKGVKWAAVGAPAGAALTEVNDTNVTLTLGGTPATSLLQAVSLTLGWTGLLAISRGGTNQATAISVLTNGDTNNPELIFASGDVIMV